MKIWRLPGHHWEAIREGVQNRILASEGHSALSLIRFEKGADFPLHKAKSRHFGVLVKGEGVFQSSKGKVSVKEGDAFLVEEGEDHAFTNTSDGESIVLEVFAPPS
jgi:quercetin dioxygenase-like cupin family protein